MREIPDEVLEKNLGTLYKNLANSNWSAPADAFICWLRECPEESKQTFQNLRAFLEKGEGEDWIIEGIAEEGNSVWDFFGYEGFDDPFHRFARDWVAEEEIPAYLAFTGKTLL